MNIALLLHLPYKVQISEIIIQFMLLVRFILFAKFYCAHTLLYYSCGIRKKTMLVAPPYSVKS
jgi:hypothetical protein